MFADGAEIPRTINRLPARVPLPHAEPDRFVSCLPGFVYASAHQLFSDSPPQPFTRNVDTHQLDRVRAVDALLCFAFAELRVTRGVSVHLRDQEARSGIFQLSRLLRNVEGFGEVGVQIFWRVISGERLREGARA